MIVCLYTHTVTHMHTHTHTHTQTQTHTHKHKHTHIATKHTHTTHTLNFICIVPALPEVTAVKEPFDTTEAGHSITLTCIASGPQLKSVTWKKESDGTTVIGDYSRRGVHSHEMSCALNCNLSTEVLADTIFRNLVHFSAPLTEAHQGTYRCEATNTIGSSYQLINIIVKRNTEN